MFIQIEETPNPNVLKFVPGESLTTGHVYEFKTEQESQPSPLAQRLFKLTGVDGILIGTDFVSDTKKDSESWDVLKPMILGSLMDHFSSGLPAIDPTRLHADAEDASGDDSSYSETEQEIVTQIRDMLDTRIRPAVAVDGGDIIFVRYEKGVVYLRLKGACSGCPSSTVTLKNGIENMLRHYIPEVLEVRAEENSDTHDPIV
jgi:Fe-S cluster biogenesis protein NfuA